MYLKKYLIFLSLLVISSTTLAVPINGKDWRQLTETTNLSWKTVSTVCSSSTGVCSGSVLNTMGDQVDFSGWNWASRNDVINLFASFNPNYSFTSQIIAEENSLWAPEIFNLFKATQTNDFGTGNLESRLTGIQRETFASALLNDINALGYQITDNTNGSRFDRMEIAPSSPRFATGINFSGDSIGFWLYKDSVQVPEPSTFLLLSLGLLGLFSTHNKLHHK